MTSLERVKTVLQGEIPDRVPVSLLSFQNATRHGGVSIAEYCVDGQRMADAQIGYWEEFRHDLIDIENGIAAMAEAVGCTVEYADDAAPWIVKPAIASLDEVDALEEIDLRATPGIRALVEATGKVARTLGEEVCIRGEADQGPFSLACEIVGTETFLTSLMDGEHAEEISTLLEYANRQIEKLIRAQIAAGSHYTMVGDSFAGPDVCSPGLYRSYALPFEKQLLTRLNNEGLGVGLHMCGDATPIIEDMVDTGALYFELDYKIDREPVLQATRGKTAILGTIDPSGVMCRGSTEDVMRAAREDIDFFAPHSRYILSPGCTLPYTTPFENVRALVEAAHEYGRYNNNFGLPG
jgi:MtaA/CmuA family methyltransferase